MKGKLPTESLTSAYDLGCRAFLDGKSSHANPFSMGGRGNQSASRKAWYDGYYETRIQTRLGPVFDRLGVARHDPIASNLGV